MHSYLRAVGFSNVKTPADLQKIVGIVMDKPTKKTVLKKDTNCLLNEISKDFGNNIGITVCGEYDEKGFFHMDHYFPYVRGMMYNTAESVIIHKRVDSDSYTALCDDVRLGVSLIVYLQNVVEYVSLDCHEDMLFSNVDMCICGLAISGTIILGMMKADPSELAYTPADKRRRKLIDEARKGDQDAIDSLTIEDIDLYAILSKRVRCEDIYSIVESSFIPYGSESDTYFVVATIVTVDVITNPLTSENVYYLGVHHNGLDFQICINQVDLVGVPSPGMRFRGNIWMQGKVVFPQ